MKNIFSTHRLHSITSANVQYYPEPFTHPKRNMQEHDFIYLLHGEWVLGQNGQSYPLERDSVLILFAGNTHYGVLPCAENTKTMYFHVSKEIGDVFSKEDPANCGVETLINASGNPNIRNLFENVVNAKLSGEQRKADLYFELLICELIDMPNRFTRIDLAQDIKNLIHANPEKSFTNAELAQALNVSVKTAETKFKKAFGKSIHQYVLEFKIKEAMSYFDKFSEISVKEVAYSLGFYDEYHFSKQFFRHTGISPNNYKKKLQSKE